MFVYDPTDGICKLRSQVLDIFIPIDACGEKKIGM